MAAATTPKILSLFFAEKRTCTVICHCFHHLCFKLIITPLLILCRSFVSFPAALASNNWFCYALTLFCAQTRAHRKQAYSSTDRRAAPMSTAYGNFHNFCRDSTLPVCNLFSEALNRGGAGYGGCELTGIPLSGNRRLRNLGMLQQVAV